MLVKPCWLVFSLTLPGDNYHVQLILEIDTVGIQVMVHSSKD